MLLGIRLGFVVSVWDPESNGSTEMDRPQEDSVCSTSVTGGVAGEVARASFERGAAPLTGSLPFPSGCVRRAHEIDT